MIPLAIFGTLILIMFVFILTSFMIVHKQKQRRYALERKEAEYKYQNQVLQTRLEVEELALKTVSREIHDNVNQILGMLRMQLFHAQQETKDPATKITIRSSNDLLKKAITIIRNLSHTLNSDGINKMGLIPAITKELNNIKEIFGIQYSFNWEDDELELPPEKQILIFRIVQEALSNIVKHSQASLVAINVEQDDEKFIVEIVDNGKGFSDMVKQKSDGLGLINMHERAKLLDGTLTIESMIGSGCLIKLKIEHKLDTDE